MHIKINLQSEWFIVKKHRVLYEYITGHLWGIKKDSGGEIMF